MGISHHASLIALNVGAVDLAQKLRGSKTEDRREELNRLAGVVQELARIFHTRKGF